jgi:hypothetical protein
VSIPDNIEAALSRYSFLSQELVSYYNERAKMQNAILQDWEDAYTSAVGEGLAYNPATAQAKAATRRWQMELNKLEGDISGALAELRYLDTYLTVMRGTHG